MDQKTSYENLLTEKLDSFPLPDMADTIWNRIDKMLEVEMPVQKDQTGHSGKVSGKSALYWGGTGFIAFVIALITLFQINKRNNTHQPVHQTTLHPATNSFIQKQDSTVQHTDPPVHKSQPFIQPQSSPPPSPARRIDSVINSPSTSLSIRDSLNHINIPKPMVITPPLIKDTTPLPKKSRGIKGLTDDDYRLAPKKDST